MRSFLLLLILLAACVSGFTETPPLRKMGKPFHPGRLDIRWQAPTNLIPPAVWVYRVLPTKFSDTVVSNVMVIGNFTAQDQQKLPANREKGSLSFSSSDGHRSLMVSTDTGILEYIDPIQVQSGRTNLAVGVPAEGELFGLTTNLLPKLGIELSEIRRTENGNGPEFSFFQPQQTIYFVKPNAVTNIPQRAVFFRRSLDGLSFVGMDRGGNGWIHFASHGKVSKISLKWPQVERQKSFPTVTPQTLLQWIRKGKAVHGFTPGPSTDIDWSAFKSLSIKRAEVCYLTGEHLVHPIASLLAKVDTGDGTFDLEIDCPVTEESAR